MIVSIYPKPHGESTIEDNEYDGKFCLHMSGSKTHAGLAPEDVNGHQAMIKKGAAYLSDPNGEYDIAVSTAYPANADSTAGTVDGGFGSSNTISPDQIQPPVKLYEKTTVYSKEGWTHWHWIKSCPGLAGVDTTLTGRQYKSRPSDVPECTECPVIWAY